MTCFHWCISGVALKTDRVAYVDFLVGQHRVLCVGCQFQTSAHVAVEIIIQTSRGADIFVMPKNYGTSLLRTCQFFHEGVDFFY